MNTLGCEGAHAYTQLPDVKGYDIVLRWLTTYVVHERLVGTLLGLE